MSARILIVEDDPDARDIMRIMLEHKGFDVVEAKDGQEALDVASSASPDLMLLDLGLPRVSGIDVLKRLRADPDTAGIRVLVVSAQVDTVTTNRDVLERDCHGVLLKPVNPTELVEAVRDCLRDDRVWPSLPHLGRQGDGGG